MHHYLAGADGVRGNATRAAIAAGFARRSAKVTASRMLTKANVAAAIKSLRDTADAAAVRKLRDWLDLAVDAQDTVVKVMSGKAGQESVAR